MKTTKWEVTGMNCVSCAGTVNNFLDTLDLKDIHVDFSNDEVTFINSGKVNEEEIIQGIEKLGFKVSLPDDPKKKDSTLSF